MNEIIGKIIAAKTGKENFILTNDNGGGWCAAIGGVSTGCPIGEDIAYGDNNVDFVAYGDTPESALRSLLAKVAS